MTDAALHTCWKRVLRRVFFLAALVGGQWVAAADYQFSVPTGDRDSRAFLWIPPDCQHVRGLLLASQVILEKRVCDDPIIRSACSRANLAIVILFRSPVGEFHYHRDLPRQKAIEQIQTLAAEQHIDIDIRQSPQPGIHSAASGSAPTSYRTADQILQKILDDLAAASGYQEIATAPLLTLGHSGGAIFAWNVAYCWPERALGVIGLHSAVILPPPWDLKARPSGFPALCISGEYESWGNPAEPLDKHWRWLRGGVLNMRGCYDAQACELVQPGGTHFNWDEPLARYVAMFIEKAAQYRIPPEASDLESSTRPAPLKVLAMDSGWLSDVTLMTPHHFAPAAFSQFKGDPSLAFWHMDRELAEAADKYSDAYGGVTDQRVTFVQDGRAVPASWIEELKFEPIEDGMTVKLDAAYLDQTPEGVAGAGQPLTHAQGPIQFRLIGGWGGGGEQSGSDTFRIHFDHFGLGNSCCNLQVMAYRAGDATYKYAEQPCQIRFPENNTQGVTQSITFPTLGAVKAGARSIALAATSDSGLPVSYLIRSGPGEVLKNQILLTPIPPRAKFPVKLTVVAYQWGRSIAPLVQTAKPVEQTILIERPQAPESP